MLMEANDNHEEEHTVAEFIEFCVNGRNSKSGEWTSKGVGQREPKSWKDIPYITDWLMGFLFHGLWKLISI